MQTTNRFSVVGLRLTPRPSCTTQLGRPTFLLGRSSPARGNRLVGQVVLLVLGFFKDLVIAREAHYKSRLPVSPLDS